jgi:hypothetical protein
MPDHFNSRWGGPIRGLCLPLRVWNTLRDEGITTLDELRAVADRLELLPGIGVKMAQITREELARVSAPEGGSPGQN